MSTDVQSILTRHTEQLAAIQRVQARIEQHMILLVELVTRPDGPQAHPDYHEWRDEFVSQVNGLQVDAQTKNAIVGAVETNIELFVSHGRLLTLDEWLTAVQSNPQRALGIRGLGKGRVERLVDAG